MIYMITVLDGFVPVALVVIFTMIRMDCFFGVGFTVVKVIDVPVVLDGFMSVSGQVFMIIGWVWARHQMLHSSVGWD